MAWTSPRTWVTGEVVTAAELNAHVRDNTIALRMQFVTSLPGSPADGNLVCLVDSLTVPTYQWQLRYVSGISDAYKWVCVGGAPAYDFDGSDNGTTDTSYASGGASVTLPGIAGIYDIAFGVSGNPGGGASSVGGMVTFVTNVTFSASDTYAVACHAAAFGGTSGAGTPPSSAYGERRVTLVAGDTSATNYIRSGTGGSSFYNYNRTISVRPQRIG